MRACKAVRLGIFIWLMLLILGNPPAAGVPEKLAPVPAKGMATPVAAPEALPRVLSQEAEALEKETRALKSRVAAAQKDLAQGEKNCQEGKAAAAVLKASLAVKGLALSQVAETTDSYSQQAGRIDKRLGELGQEIETLKKEQAARETTQARLQTQVSSLQATRQALTRSREMKEAYQRYQRLATAQSQTAALLLDTLQREFQVLQAHKDLLAETQVELQKYKDEFWKEELLKRQEHVSYRKQIVRLWQTATDLPGRIQGRLLELISSGSLGTFLEQHLAPLIGLLAFMVLLAWGSRRLTGLTAPWLLNRRSKAQTLTAKALLSLGKVLTAHLFLLGLILWLWLFIWTLGLSDARASWFCFYLLVFLVALVLGWQAVQAACAGEAAGGFLPLGKDTARFYRRSLKLFLLYLVLGFLVLTYADLLGFRRDSRIFLGHLFRIGFLGWLLWLLRARHLPGLLERLPVPTWLRRPGFMRVVRNLVWALLATIILAALWGFHVLALYVAHGAVLTLAVLIFLGFLWLVVGKILFSLLHPETGWASRRYPDRQEVLQKYYREVHRLITIILAAAALLGALQAWGVNLGKLAWAFQWLAWGPAIGPLRLTPVTVGCAALALYLGFWLSRLVRTLMQVRVYPRTGWDHGIQYTISTMCHYGILILAGLLALNILGFPLTNLALVAGALGVGIGFGLQNIVNNFISGLILLFERPIKVGDMLVIDGQWGQVREIRVRSTIFETNDRSVIIIPNSELISNKVTNWTHYGRGISRLTLKVGVGSDANVQQVTRLVTDVCRANPRVVADPPPQVFFSAYGESSLDFTVWVYVKNPDDRTPATHELNSAILEAFQKYAVEIPSPQRDLYIRNWPPALTKEKE